MSLLDSLPTENNGGGRSLLDSLPFETSAGGAGRAQELTANGFDNAEDVPMFANDRAKSGGMQSVMGITSGSDAAARAQANYIVQPDTFKNMVVPVPALAAAQVAQGIGGKVRQIGDVAGFDGMASWGKDFAQSGADVEKQIQAEHPLDEGTWANSIRNAGASMYQQLPSMVAAGPLVKAGMKGLGMATALVPMGAVTGGQSYGKYRDRGFDVAAASGGSAVDELIEVGTELLPAGRLLTYATSPAKLAVKQLASTMIKMGAEEYFGETLAALGQGITNKYLTDPNLTEEQRAQLVNNYFTKINPKTGNAEYFDDFKEAWRATTAQMVMTAGMGAGAKRLTQSRDNTGMAGPAVGPAVEPVAGAPAADVATAPSMPVPTQPVASFQNEAYGDTEDMGPLTRATAPVAQATTAQADDNIPAFTPPTTPVTPEPAPPVTQGGMAPTSVAVTDERGVMSDEKSIAQPSTFHAPEGINPQPVSQREVTDADQVDFENAVQWEANLNRQNRTALPVIEGETERDRAWRLLSEYRKAITPMIAKSDERGVMNDENINNSSLIPQPSSMELPNGVTNPVSTLSGPANMDGTGLVVPEVQAKDSGPGSNLSQPGGVTDGSLQPVSQEGVQGQKEVPDVREEDVNPFRKAVVNSTEYNPFGQKNMERTGRGSDYGDMWRDTKTKKHYVHWKNEKDSWHEYPDYSSAFKAMELRKELAEQWDADHAAGIDAAAHVAATSPHNDTPVPTAAQIEAGNYKKGHVAIQGLNISIENPAGSSRKGVDENGKTWEVKIKHHYGYIKGTIGRDKDHIDVFIGENPESNKVYVIDQINPKTGKLDEHKVLLGFDTSVAARTGYLANYDASGPTRIGAMTETSMAGFKGWLEIGDKNNKFAGAALATGTAPEHVDAGVTDKELGEIVQEFNDAQQSMVEMDDRPYHLFDPPKKSEIVRLQDKTKVYHAEYGWMSVEEARKQIDIWKKHAQDQGNPRVNSDKIVLSLFDLSGEWSKPWVEAGYQVFRFDIQDDPEVGDVHNFSTEFFNDWFSSFDGMDIHAILAATPCTDFAVSGARHFAAKDKDGRTISSVKLVHQTIATIEYFKPAVWALENPVGRIEKLGGLPPWRLSFDPNHIGEPYTKKTLLWGRFNADLPVAPVDPVEGSKMWAQYGGKSQATKNARSVTPEGFAYAFFMANNAVDHPAMAVSGKYDRLDPGIIKAAVDAGVTPQRIDELVEEYYYQELDDDAAEQALVIETEKMGVGKKAAAVPVPVKSPAELKKEENAAKFAQVRLKALEKKLAAAATPAEKKKAQKLLDAHKATMAGDGPIKVKTVRTAKPVEGLNPQRDHLLTAIAKMGGLDLANAVSLWGNMAGDAAADKKINGKLFGRPLFRKSGGMTVDGMAELLAEHGYLRRDENGKHDLRDLEEKISNAIAGKTVVSDQNHQEIQQEVPVFSAEEIAELEFDATLVETIETDIADLFELLAEDDYNIVSAHWNEAIKARDALIKEITHGRESGRINAQEVGNTADRTTPEISAGDGNINEEGTSPVVASETGKGTGSEAVDGFQLTAEKAAPVAKPKEKQDTLFATPPQFGSKPTPDTKNDLTTSQLSDNLTSTESVQSSLVETPTEPSPRLKQLTDIKALLGTLENRSDAATIERLISRDVYDMLKPYDSNLAYHLMKKAEEGIPALLHVNSGAKSNKDVIYQAQAKELMDALDRAITLIEGKDAENARLAGANQPAKRVTPEERADKRQASIDGETDPFGIEWNGTDITTGTKRDMALRAAGYETRTGGLSDAGRRLAEKEWYELSEDVKAKIKANAKGWAAQREEQSVTDVPAIKQKTKPVADAGEELIYNKRNRLKGLKWDDIKDATGALKAESVQKKNVYAQPDYVALVADGMPELIAHIVKQVYDSISVAPVTRITPTDADFHTYITAVNRVMDATLAWAQDLDAIAAWGAKNSKGYRYGETVSIGAMAAKVTQPYDLAYPGGWRNFREEVTILGGNIMMSRLQPGYNEISRAGKDVAKGWPGKIAAWQRQGYSLGSKDNLVLHSTNQSDGTVYTSIRLGNRSLNGFHSTVEAQAFLDALKPVLLLRKNYKIVDSFGTQAEAEAAAKKLVTKEQKDGPDERGVNVATAVRIGPARRLEGENVTAQQIIDAFGYRGINIGNWVPDDEAQLHLNFIYDSSYDLAELLGLPLQAVSFNGTIGIAVGAQGGGKASAHYVPAYKEVNITRNTGAGAFIHELLGHGFDNYFGEMAGWSTDKKPYLSKHLDNNAGGTVRPEVIAALRTIMKTMGRRQETPQEVIDRVKRGAEASEKSFEKYVARFEAYFEGIAEGGKAEAARLFERLRARDFGDAYVSISSSKAVFPVIADLYQLARKYKVAPKYSSKISLDDFQWLHTAAYGVKRSAEMQGQEHTPITVNTNYANASQAADAGKSATNLYWSTPWEMFARAVDAYITDKIASLDQKNTYLSGIEAVAPFGEERKAINAAFDVLFGELKTKETEKGIAVFEKGEIYGTLDSSEVSYEITSVHNEGTGSGRAASNGSSSTGLARNVDSAGAIQEQLGLFLPAAPAATSKPLATDFNFGTSFAALTTPAPQFASKVVRVVSGILHSPLTKIKTIKDAARVAQPIANRAQEGLIAIVVDKSGKILGVVQHSTGSANQSIVHPRDLSGVILDFPGAEAVYLAHNHPTGDPTPSPEDYAITKRVARVLQAAGIEVKASIQIGFTGEYQSFSPLYGTDREMGSNDPAEERGKKLSIYDRNIESIAIAEPRMTSALDFKDARERYFPGQTGILLIDGKNRSVGFIPMAVWEMLRLSTGSKESGAGRIMHRMHETGAVGLMLSIDDVHNDLDAVENVISFGSVLGVRVLDATPLTGASMQERGMLPTGGDVFYSTQEFNAPKIVNSLSGHIKQDMNKLIQLGQAAIRDGAATYQQFVAGMKKYLGDKWGTFRQAMISVYQQAKKIVADERGMVGRDINAVRGGTRPFTSRLAEVVEQKMSGKMLVPQLKAMLKNNNVTDDEIANILDDVIFQKEQEIRRQKADFDAAQGWQEIGGVLGDVGAKVKPPALDTSVSKAEVLEAIQAGSVELKDVVLGKPVEPATPEQEARYNELSLQKMHKGLTEAEQVEFGHLQWDGSELATHFSTYVEQGAVAGSYREMFVTAPSDQKPLTKLPESRFEITQLGKMWQVKDLVTGSLVSTDTERDRAVKDALDYTNIKIARGLNIKGWQDGHTQYSDIQNPIVRVRFNDREVAGKRILFVEEMQGPSDDNQQKMPAYLVKRIYDIGVKRILAYAKEHGYSGVSWTTGEMQTKRYDLTLHFSKIEALANPDGTYNIFGYNSADKRIVDKLDVAAQALPGVVGKDLAEKIVKQPWVRGEYKDLDLKVGGEGLISLYDKTLPALFKKYGKESTEKIDIDTTETRPLYSVHEYVGPDASLEQVEEAYKASASYGRDNFISPITGERLMFSINRVANSQSLKATIAGMKEGFSFKEMVTTHGVDAAIFGGTVQQVHAENKDTVAFVPVTGKTPDSYPLYAAAPAAISGVAAADISGIVEKANALSSARLSVVQSSKNLPDFVQADMKRRGITKPEAVTFTKDGVTHIVYIADNISGTKRMAALMRHEWFHAGVVDKELDALHRYYSQKRPDQLTAIAEQRKFDMSTADGRRQAAGELAAQEAEKGRINLYVRQIMAKIRKFLNAIGATNSQFGDAEIADIIRKAIGRVTEQADNGGYLVGQMTTGSPLFSIDKNGKSASMIEKGDSYGTQPGDGERTLGRLGKSKTGDFAAAKNVAGGAYLASTENARSRDIRSEEERQLKEFALQHGLMLDAGPMMVEVERQGISGLDNHVYAEGTAFIKINKFTHTGTFSDLFTNITLHNKIFPEARLDFEGFVQTDNGLRPVFSQAYFENEMTDKFQRIDLVNLASDDLLRRGFKRTEGTNKTVENAVFARNDIVVRDISYRNVAYQGGAIKFFDPVVELKPEARTRENLRSILNGDENNNINYSLREQLNKISEATTLDNLKDFLNPLDYSRFRDYQIDHRSPKAINSLAEHLGTPFWKKENNPAAVPFYEEAKDREVTRMDNNIRMYGGLVDKEGKRVGWEKAKGLFDWSDKTTAWGKIRQEQYSNLTDQQKAAYDVIRFEGDAYNKVYARLADALRNKRIKAAGLDEATFTFYQSAIAEEEKAFEVKIAIAAENMAEAGISPEDIEGHISEFRSKYASIKGWVHRDHGEGDYQVRVYQTVDRLDFESDVVQHKGEAADRLRLGTYPGAELTKQIEALVEMKGSSFKQLRNGAIIILMPEGAGVQMLDAIDDIPLTDKDGEYKYQVLTYNRFVASSAAAKKLASQVKGNYAAAMPRNYRPGFVYDTSWNLSDKVQEEDYQVLKTSDMKLELILRNAIDKAKARNEVSAEDAAAIKDELVRSTAEILLGRGAGLYQIRRAQYLIEGYDTDNAVKKYEDYINGTAGLFSKARYALRQFHNMKSAPASIRAWATKYVSDSLRNMGTGDKVSGNIRAIVSLWYLGFNTSWMLVNSTQPYVLGQAELSRYTKGALGKIATAEKDILTGKLSAAEKALLEDIQVRSQDHDSVMAEMTGSLEGVTGKASQTLHNVTQVAMALGQKVEVLNRHTMIVAAYRVFTGQGMSHDKALKKALDVNSMVNIDMGRYNLPGWARVPVGRTFYALQSYIQHMLNYLWNRSSSGNRVDQKAVLRLLFAMFLIGGLPAGAPGSDELDKLILMIFGYSPKLALKEWSRKRAKEYGSAGEMLEGFVWHGVPGAAKPFGVGVSLTGSTQLRIPFLTSVIGGDDMFKALGGPVSGLVTKGRMSLQAAIRGDYGRSVEYLLPTAVANPLSAIRQATDGVRTGAGKRVEYQGKQLKMTAGEAAIRTFGLQPARTADISEMRGFEKDIAAEYNDKRKVALSNYRNSRKLKYIQEFNIDLKNSQAKGLVPLITAETMANVWGKTNQKKNAWEREHGAD